MAGGIGPQLPPEVAAMLSIPVNRQSDDNDSSSDAEAIGPAMPPPGVLPARLPSSGTTLARDEDGESEDDDIVGPSAALAGYSKDQALRQTMDMIEARAHKGEDPTTANSVEKREEWMLVPPSAESSKAMSGRGNGGRSVVAAPLFDKSWTETPEEKRQNRETPKRREPAVEEETPGMRRKREESAEKSKWVEEYNRSERPKSLMEMHLESKSKGREKKRGRSDKSRARERSPPSRRADKRSDDDDEWKSQRFDRSRDLSTGKVDSRRQREMLNTMGFLSDKYAPSKGGSFM
ncbi:hypothetical protein IWW37_002236 [Coemansia sp. RSA 2050]|nr:hypothetical protein IWW37_002236 [Coemansia sp. RSA 2050]KAJ2733422.1 hypothetical protein IW152_003059 [Coemansia sp. BCRC 34962]